jgi:phosphopantetheine adenylyltransferase
VPEKVLSKSVLMAPHDRILWVTHPDQILQLEEIIVPLLKEFETGNEFRGLSVIIRLENEEQKNSVRFQYGVLFAVYQKVTLLSSRLSQKLTSKLDLRVYLEHLCNIKKITNHFQSSILFVMYENDNLSEIQKQNVKFLQVPRKTCQIFFPESPLLVSVPNDQSFNSVALGGTFDHLHSGHKLMLSLAALLSHDRILCGITASEMLESKNHPDKLEPLEQRMLTVQKFLCEFKQDFERNVEIVTLRDPFGPTIELDDLEALVVSPETLPGGLKSNFIGNLCFCLYYCVFYFTL